MPNQDPNLSHLDALKIIEMVSAEHQDGSGSEEDNLAGIIYEIAHSARAPNCTKNHPTMLENALKLKKIFMPPANNI